MSQPYQGRTAGFSLTDCFRMRILLPLGFAAVLVAMAAALVKAYEIHRNPGRAPDPGQEAFVPKEEVLTLIQSRLSETQRLARDFLLGGWPHGTARYMEDVQQIEYDVDTATHQLEQVGTSRELVALLRTRLQTYWDTLEKLRNWPEEMRAKHGYEFMRVQIPFARRPVNDILRALHGENENTRRKLVADLAAARQAEVGQLFVLMAAATGLALATAAITLARVRELEHESVHELQEIGRAKLEMQQLSARLFTVQEEERRRLSRELHDGIGQILTALQVEIAYCQQQQGSVDSSGRGRLQKARMLSEEAIRMIHDLSLLLRPSALDDLGLEAALQWQVQEFQRRTEIPCTFSAAGLHEDLSGAWKTCAYRIVQEALNNCEKHATPTRVRIRVCQEPELLIVEVEDDGAGFDLNAKGAPLHVTGLGILGMRERAAMLGGAVTITSAPGRGTMVCVKLPLANIATAGNQTLKALDAGTIQV